MPASATVEEIVPLIQALPPRELARLLRLIALLQRDDSAAYQATPPGADEFSTDADLLAWEGDGWEIASNPR